MFFILFTIACGSIRARCWWEKKKTVLRPFAFKSKFQNIKTKKKFEGSPVEEKVNDKPNNQSNEKEEKEKDNPEEKSNEKEEKEEENPVEKSKMKGKKKKERKFARKTTCKLMCFLYYALNLFYYWLLFVF